MAEREKRRATTFRTSRGAIVNVTYPDIYIAPSIAPVDVTSPAEMRVELGKATGKNYLSVMAVKAAAEWIFQCQHPTNGGLRYEYSRDTKTWTGVYPEVSGYTIPTLYEISMYENNNFWTVMANWIADWLLTVQLPSGAFPDIGLVNPYTFDTTACLWGLLEAYLKTGTAAYRTACVNAANWLLTQQNPDRSFTEVGTGYATSYMSHIAWLLYRMYILTGTASYKTAAEGYVAWILTQVKANYWVDRCGNTAGASLNPSSHFISYCVDGLKRYGLRRNDSSVIATAKNIDDALLEAQRMDGGLYHEYKSDWTPYDMEKVDPTAGFQAIRNWMFWYRLYGDPKYLTASLRAWLYGLEWQDRASLDPGLFGGVTAIAEEKNNPIEWATKFLIEAGLALYPEMSKIRIPVKTEDKVFDALAIRDALAHTSNLSKLVEITSKSIVVQNGLDQPVALYAEGDRRKDFGNSHRLGPTDTYIFTVPVTSNRIETLTDEVWIMRLVAQCSVAPTSGALTVYVQKRSIGG